MHRAAAIVVSGAPLAISDGTHAVPVNLLRPPLHPLHQLQRNSDQRKLHQTKRTTEAHALLVRKYVRKQEVYCIRFTVLAIR